MRFRAALSEMFSTRRLIGCSRFVPDVWSSASSGTMFEARYRPQVLDGVAERDVVEVQVNRLEQPSLNRLLAVRVGPEVDALGRPCGPVRSSSPRVDRDRFLFEST